MDAMEVDPVPTPFPVLCHLLPSPSLPLVHFCFLQLGDETQFTGASPVSRSRGGTQNHVLDALHSSRQARL